MGVYVGDRYVDDHSSFSQHTHTHHEVGVGMGTLKNKLLFSILAIIIIDMKLWLAGMVGMWWWAYRPLCM